MLSMSLIFNLFLDPDAFFFLFKILMVLLFLFFEFQIIGLPQILKFFENLVIF